jgi:AcrR family transcriptional regulator
MFVSAHPAVDTKTRLLAAATELFATRGFHGTKVRDIATRAGVNVAAGNYHYGSKKELYLEVLRGQFADVRAQIARRGAALDARTRLPRATLVDLLRARVRVMFDVMVGPPGLHGQLMQREMSDPSEAFPVIVAEFIEPMVAEMSAIVARLAPALGPEEVRRCVASIAGQVQFYLFAKPAVGRLFGPGAYSRRWSQEVTDHITRFSLAGLSRPAVRRGSRAH